MNRSFVVLEMDHARHLAGVTVVKNATDSEHARKIYKEMIGDLQYDSMDVSVTPPKPIKHVVHDCIVLPIKYEFDQLNESTDSVGVHILTDEEKKAMQEETKKFGQGKQKIEPEKILIDLRKEDVTMLCFLLYSMKMGIEEVGVDNIPDSDALGFKRETLKDCTNLLQRLLMFSDIREEDLISEFAKSKQ
jgi:hypothetical protein